LPGSEDVASFEQLAERHAKLLALVRWLNELPEARGRSWLSFLGKSYPDLSRRTLIA